MSRSYGPLDHDEPKFFKVQIALVNNGYLKAMSDKTLKVYVALCKFRNNDTGNCFPTIDRLCEETGLCKASVIKAVQELDEKEYKEKDRKTKEVIKKKGLGLIKTWKNRKQGNQTFKKFYHVKDVPDISPTRLDLYQSPHRWTYIPRERDVKGRFIKGESNTDGPSESNAVGLSESNGDGLKLYSSNYTTLTKNALLEREKENPSFKGEKKPMRELAPERAAEIREYIETNGLSLKWAQEHPESFHSLGPPEDVVRIMAAKGRKK